MPEHFQLYVSRRHPDRLARPRSNHRLDGRLGVACSPVDSPGAPAPDNALAPTQRQEEPPRCNIVAVLCASMLHRAGYAKRDQPP